MRRARTLSAISTCSILLLYLRSSGQVLGPVCPHYRSSPADSKGYDSLVKPLWQPVRGKESDPRFPLPQTLAIAINSCRTFRTLTPLPGNTTKSAAMALQVPIRDG